MTPTYDIYQCGQILWMLAAGWASPNKSALHWKQEFYNGPKSLNRGFWFGLDLLPELPDTVPSWYRHLIRSCCRAEPNARPSCRHLLDQFPPVDISTKIRTSTVSSFDARRDFPLQDCIWRSIVCDHCRRPMRSLLYHLSQCGDADVCPQCFGDGKHCQDSQHFLTEMDVTQPLPSATCFHSSPDTSGKRRVFAQ